MRALLFYNMSNIFLCSDHHIGHMNLLNFKRNDGVTPLRSFNDVNHMNEHIVAQHNKVVGVNDRVYFLGDFCFNKRDLHILSRMNGRKVLIKGNHDKLDLKDYILYFDDIRGSHQFDGMILTHIPVHPESLGRWPLNVHGHLHANIVTTMHHRNGDMFEVPDPRYFSVCMEQLDDYIPISLEELKKRVKILT